MRILRIQDRSIPISRYADPGVISDALDTSAVAITVDAGHGDTVTGYGFSSVGRFAQSGLIRDRFAPRLLAARHTQLADERGDLDPTHAWNCMMKGEKSGGHGERCVAVGALDMALWDAAAKLAGLPFYKLLARRFNSGRTCDAAPAYFAGGYLHPDDDLYRLREEIAWAVDRGFRFFKIKVGASPLHDDLKRIEAVLELVGGGDHLAVDAMNCYDAKSALDAARAFSQYGLKWFEDICNPLDYETHARIADVYEHPIAAGEALFSDADAVNLFRYGGLRRDRDILVFDPVHCYGLPGFLRIVAAAYEHGWLRQRFWPHGGHLFGLHLVCGLCLGGAEANPHNFQPFGGFQDGLHVSGGLATPPDLPGVGWESRPALHDLFASIRD